MLHHRLFGPQELTSPIILPVGVNDVQPQKNIQGYKEWENPDFDTVLLVLSELRDECDYVKTRLGWIGPIREGF